MYSEFEKYLLYHINFWLKIYPKDEKLKKLKKRLKYSFLFKNSHKIPFELDKIIEFYKNKNSL